jgi:aminobenzoyl-glutamate utilization protein B
MRPIRILCLALLALTLSSVAASAQRQRAPVDSARLVVLKQEIAREIEGMHTFTQQMVDQVFSYGELGFQETESSRYLVGILRRNGFTVQQGIAGIPTAWMATWGAGKPVITLGSDIDGIPQASQKPGVAYRAPLVEGAPGHGEGHNSGLPVVITAAIATKKVMQREGIPGTIRIWPGVAEELVAAKAWFVREGFFKDVDVTIFTHVGSNLEVS